MLCANSTSMKIKIIIGLSALLVLITSFTTGYDWAQAWVQNTILHKSNLPEIVQKQIKRKGVSLVLLTKKYLIITQFNGNTYLQCFLINNTDSIVSINRADATIVGFSTEILKDKVWQHFQRDIGSSCGNSYWFQKLGDQQALSIQLDHAESGDIKIPFRIKYIYNGTVIYSNSIMVDIDQKNYDRVGKTKIKSGLTINTNSFPFRYQTVTQ